MEEECISSCLHTMLNLSSLPHHTPAFLLNKYVRVCYHTRITHPPSLCLLTAACSPPLCPSLPTRAVPTLSELSFRLRQRDNLLATAEVLHNLSASAPDAPASAAAASSSSHLSSSSTLSHLSSSSTLERMVQGGAHKALVRLMSPLTHGVDRWGDGRADRHIGGLILESADWLTRYLAGWLAGCVGSGTWSWWRCERSAPCWWSRLTKPTSWRPTRCRVGHSR